MFAKEGAYGATSQVAAMGGLLLRVSNGYLGSRTSYLTDWITFPPGTKRCGARCGAPSTWGKFFEMARGKRKEVPTTDISLHSFTGIVSRAADVFLCDPRYEVRNHPDNKKGDNEL